MKEVEEETAAEMRRLAAMQQFVRRHIKSHEDRGIL